MVSNASEMVLNGAKCWQMVPNGFLLNFPGFLMHFKRSSLNIFTRGLFNQRRKNSPKNIAHQKTFEPFFLLFRYFVLLLFFNIVQKGLKSSKMSKNVSKLTKIVQYSSKASKNFRKPPKTFKSLQKPPKASKSLQKPQNTSKTKSL